MGNKLFEIIVFSLPFCSLSLSVFLYIMQLYKNTRQNIKKKRNICKKIYIIIGIMFFTCLFINEKQIDERKDDVGQKEYSIEENDVSWKKVYLKYIQEYYSLKSEEQFFDDNECKFAIYDIDKDGVPELFTYYFEPEDISTYEEETGEVTKIASQIVSRHQILYGSNYENELIILGWYGSGCEASIMCVKEDLGIEKKYCYASYENPMEKILERKYYYDDNMYGIHKNVKEITKDEYDDAVEEMLFRKSEIQFYKISAINERDLSLFITCR